MAEELDRATLMRCRRGEARAFRALVERYQDRVYALGVALAGAADAEDVAQETFVRVHAALPEFDVDAEGRLSAWILTIARRLCADRARRRQRRARLEVRMAPAEPQVGAEQTLEREQAAATVRAALAGLPEEQRAVLALQLWDELGYVEIAAVEGVPVGTVRSRLSRAKQALRRALGWRGAGDSGGGESGDGESGDGDGGSGGSGSGVGGSGSGVGEGREAGANERERTG
jgi:RNA polymerase sigma-70 factor (ECF subfamily)